MIEQKQHMPPVISIERDREIRDWVVESTLRITGGIVTYDRKTFEATRTWCFTTEADRTLFLLKWGDACE